MRASRALLLFCICGLFSLEARESPVTSAEFAAQAYPTLAVEEPYAFHEVLSHWREPLRRDFSAVPEKGELALPDTGWTVRIAAGSGEVVRTAAQEFQAYLRRSMRVQIAVEMKPELGDWHAARNAIIVGTREQLAGCGDALTGSKDYRLVVTSQGVVVCGYDEPGAMHGLYNLEQRMDLREAPFLTMPLDAVRHSLYKTRMTQSGLGWEEWPDPYLALLSRYGFDGIYAANYANALGGPGTPPLWDHMRQVNPAHMNDLVKRASRYGIKVYCPILYVYTGEPDNVEGLRQLVHDTVTACPGIQGYILLTEGFYYKTWIHRSNDAWANRNSDVRSWLTHWDEGCGIVAEEAHKINPSIEILPWEYNIDFRPGNVELKRFGTASLPRDTTPLLTFENGKDFSLDGEHAWLKDYAINVTGPAEVTVAQIQAARENHLRGVYVKADTWASWQFGTFPYLPIPYQWYDRYRALEKCGVDGVLESWTYGFQPNFVAEMRNWYSWSEAPDLNTFLTAVARREFGAGQETLALKAWDAFSKAIRLLSDTGPNMGTNSAVGAPLFFERPQPRMGTVYHSWSDEKYYGQVTGLNPDWPYTAARVILNPDFSNKTNVAEKYASPFSLRVFMKYQRVFAAGFEEGLQSYREAALRAPAPKRANAFREVLLAEQMQRMVRSAQAVLEFEDLRIRLSRTHDRPGQALILDRMTVILREELARTRDSWETARRDSRLGYEWENDYLCPVDMIAEKLGQLDHTLTALIPAYRQKHSL